MSSRHAQVHVRRSGRRRRRRCAPPGFTLVEVLATLLLMAIVLPVAMRAVTISTTIASDTRRRGEAAGLAEAKLNELIATGQWNGGVMTGDFASDGFSDYTWTAEVNNWYSPVSSTTGGTDPGNSLSEIDLHVSWRARNREFSVSVSTLVYQSNQSSSTSSSSSSTSTSSSGNKATGGSGGKSTGGSGGTTK